MYSYNQAGRVTAQHMDYDYGRNTFDAAYSWDSEGRMTNLNYGPSYQLQYDVNGRLSGMSSEVTATYGVAGEMTGLSYFGFSETRTYNSMLQMTQQTVTNGGTTVMDMQYRFDTTGHNNGRMVSSVDGVSGETVNYEYDALNRLSSAAATSGAWGQAFAYDGFGNLTNKTVTAGSAPTLSVSFDPATNRQAGVAYDANGNPEIYGAVYDVENRMTAGYSYDPYGKRVKKGSDNETYELYFYGIGGQKLATFAKYYECAPTCGLKDALWYNVYFGGKLVKSKGVVVATDRLGSVRANSNGERMSYYPYGEERTSTADNREKFGTYMRDSSGQDYADQRYYNVGTGRFGTADPSTGSRAADPGSWNKYAYVGGDPINFTDRHGLFSDPTLTAEDCFNDMELCIEPPPPPGGPPPPQPEPEPEPMKYRTYFLIVQGQAGAPGDCYRVPTNGGSVTREVTYRLEFMEEGMPTPLGYGAVITEHLTGDLPNSGQTSPSSSAPGWFPDQHSILAGKSVQNLAQNFTAMINGVDVGLAIMGAFGGNWQQLNIEKHAGYVSINGDIGGRVDANGKLISRTYTPCK
jgi:RHS repeat-associated protein